MADEKSKIVRVNAKESKAEEINAANENDEARPSWIAEVVAAVKVDEIDVAVKAWQWPSSSPNSSIELKLRQQ